MRGPAAAAYGLLALADTALASRATHHRARLVTKPLLLPVLALASGRRDLRAPHALSWVGDLFLMRHGERTFLAGLSSFLGAHVAYVAAYRGRSSVPVLGTSGRRGLLAAGSLASVGMGLAARRTDPALLVPVAVYGTTLTTMVAAAAAIDPERGRGLVLTGASLFLLSDTLIGLRAFVLGDDRAPAGLEAAVMATYTAAQWCIADGLSRP